MAPPRQLMPPSFLSGARSRRRMSDVRMRPYADGDLERITKIYNSYVRTSIATFDVEPVTPAQYAEWVRAHTAGEGHRIWVATEYDRIIGYAGAGPFRTRPACDRTVETSIYVDAARTGQGLGTSLYGRLLESLADTDLHRAVAVIAEPNPASNALHRALGFREVARLTEAGWKFGKYWDVAIFERGLP